MQVTENELKRIIAESVRETLLTMGFDVHEPHKAQADMLYIRKAREGAEEMVKLAKRSAIGIAVSLVAYALVEGARVMMARG
jgi:hypothetical protein